MENKPLAVKEDSRVKKPEFELFELLKKTDVDRPNPKDIIELKKFLKAHPELWGAVVNLAESAATQLIDMLKASAASKEMMKVNWTAIKDDYGYKTATSSLEKMLIEQVALCWLRLNLTEQGYNNVMYGSGSILISQGDYWERRLSNAQKRYLRAVETLAKVRKLARTTQQYWSILNRK